MKIPENYKYNSCSIGQLASSPVAQLEGKNREATEFVESLPLVPAQWRRRHFKFINRFGLNRYREVVSIAQADGINPTRLLAFIVDRELKGLQA